MDWELREAVAYYQKQGAPASQTAVIALLREAQAECGGELSEQLLQAVAELLGVKVTFLQAIIRRIPDLRLAEKHVMELCAGQNCRRSRALAVCAEKLQKERGFTLRYAPCMRLCGKGPNLRWDGKVYYGADEALIRKLTDEV